MKRLLSVLSMAILTVCMASCGNNSQSGVVEADNTAQNARDRGDGTVTAEDQSGTEADREITANIRKAVVDDDSLSINAHNVKIVTINGEVTLRGPVKSADEKRIIAEKAKQVSGVNNVVDLLEIEN